LVWGHYEVVAENANRIVVRVINLDLILTCIPLSGSVVSLSLRESLRALEGVPGEMTRHDYVSCCQWVLRNLVITHECVALMVMMLCHILLTICRRH